MSELFASLARRAMRPLAIGPRLPSRFETLPASGAAVTMGRAEAGGDGPASIDTAAARGGENLAMPGITPVAVPVLAPITAPLTPPIAASFTAPTPARRATAREAHAPALPAGAAPAPARDVSHAALAQAAVAATQQLSPLLITAGEAAPHVPGLPGSAEKSRESASAGIRSIVEVRAAGPGAALTTPPHVGLPPERLAQVERLEAPPRIDRPAAAASAVALPAITPTFGRSFEPPHPPAAPRVDITIGSIDVVFTAAPAPAAVPRAPAVSAPAVQSLDDYLQSRQRRGGPR